MAVLKMHAQCLTNCLNKMECCDRGCASQGMYNEVVYV